MTKAIRPRMSTKPTSQGNRDTSKLIVLIVLLLAVLYGIYFFNTHEKVSTGITYLPKPKTQEPYYAARAYLNAQDKDAAYLDGRGRWDELQAIFADTEHAADTTIFIAQMDASLESQLQPLMRWVSAGGHVVLFETPVFDIAEDDQALKAELYERNPLYESLGISAALDDDEAEGNHPFYQTLLRAPSGEYFVVSNSQVPYVISSTYPMYHDYAAFAGRVPSISQLRSVFAGVDQEVLGDLQAYWAQDPKFFDPHHAILDLAVDQGRVTILKERISFANPFATGIGSKQWGVFLDGPDDDHQASTDEPAPTTPKASDTADSATILWRNFSDIIGHRSQAAYYGGIKDFDHAYLLEIMTQGRQQIYFVNQVAHDDLLTLLLKHAKLLLGAIALAIVAALLALPRQFGRQQRYLAYQNRDVLAFFAHIGQYLWATDKAKQLVTDNRQALFERIYARHPQTQTMDRARLTMYLAQLTHLSTELIDDALYKDYENQSEFIRLSRAFALLSKTMSSPHVSQHHQAS